MENKDPHYTEIIDNTKNDFGYSWPSSSRFIWLLTIFMGLSWILGGCYKLYEHRYKGKPDVVVPDNTLYNPKYK